MSRLPVVDARRHSVEEYFRIDDASEARHEYVDGRVVAMAGGSDEHSQIIVNLLAEARGRLRGTGCTPRDGNLRVRFGKTVLYGYADALIVCGKLQFDPNATTDTLLNPRVVFEVLSESTEAYDRGKKFGFYRKIESLQEYVLIAQDHPSVEVYRRDPETGFWILQPHEGIQAGVHIRSAGIELPLAELYDGIIFPPQSLTSSPTRPPDAF